MFSDLRVWGLRMFKASGCGSFDVVIAYNLAL